MAKEVRIIGVIGAGEAEEGILKIAEDVGRLIAKSGIILITGGLYGVMEAASRGAYMEGGLTVGILPGNKKEDANLYVKLPIATGLGEARNALIARASDVLIAIGGEYGTLSEIALALKMGKKVIGINTWKVPGVVEVKGAEDAILEALK